MSTMGGALKTRAELRIKLRERYHFGRRLKEMRCKKGITLKELSRLTGLSTGALSLIENGLVTPTIDTLVKLVRSLGTRLSYLVESLEKEGVGICEVVKREMVPLFYPARSHYFLRRASGDGHGRMDSFIVESNQGRAWELPESSHEGEEFVYVLFGEVSVTIGDRELELEEGDSLYFDARFRHRFRGGPGSKMLVVFAP